ncbi:hypothetical protein [Pseudoalteromonas sp. BDTF-M6]|uniref:hypothetical protein n=1 Tax=Pseudoalteromonas sp. BDTF-M6 TaxID=2796132 RepID=UPI001BAE763B|nr:hypothetical protein [Pseudoalteromonas sp. BDTF-M6]MBS3796681.1 hypothetical protein [Pseudoalteromonas sp. BDTF-M6]
MPQQKKPNTTFDWFDIFRAGTHTDSKGTTQEFSSEDLQSVVANFEAKKSPLVIGHPKIDDPAWGWASALKVEDGVLYAQAEDVCGEFADAVADKRYPNRSVQLFATDDGGYRLGHIGYLGGKPPAVDGLSWQFNAEDNAPALTFEFSAADDADRIALQTSNVVTRLVKNLRTFIADKFGTETADQVVPEWEAEWLKEQTVIAEHVRNKDVHSEYSANPESDPHTPDEDNTVTEEERQALEDQLKAEQDKNAQLEYNQRLAAAQTFIDKEVNGGDAPRLTKTEGVAEFMASLETEGEQTFEFAAADGEQPQQLKSAAWFKSFLTSLPEQKGLAREFNKQEGDDEPEELNAQQLASKALEYQKSQADQGVTISVSQAMAHVTKEGA